MILGIDPGERRVGVAVADLETRFARPVEVIDAREVDPVTRILELAIEMDIEKIVVGRPVGLSGRAGPAVERQQVLVTALRSSSDIDIVEYDERMTTIIADQALRASGKSAKASKNIRDAVAAQILLQGYMDSTS